jgi:hypothetical protein
LRRGFGIDANAGARLGDGHEQISADTGIGA